MSMSRFSTLLLLLATSPCHAATVPKTFGNAAIGYIRNSTFEPLEGEPARPAPPCTRCRHSMASCCCVCAHANAQQRSSPAVGARSSGLPGLASRLSSAARAARLCATTSCSASS